MKVENFKLYKPYGFLSQFLNNQTKRKNKKLLGELHEFPPGSMAIGRLDEDSEGLLFITTSGNISEEVRSKKVEKEYYVQVDGSIDPQAIERLKDGVEISVNGQKYLTLPCRAYLLKTPPALPVRLKKVRDDRHGLSSWISITLVEGKFRQIRKMTAVVGYPTLRLVRVRIGQETIEGFSPGEVREVSEFLLDI
ncbi:pseudouridine synthase [Antarcticibacterium sp. 1MA-6-2]|uniref:pseudouridine synthase n=1 Tax=Antarcticibacterium sp. 1MA-6-2 TaxID=2908210 RepID=UPI001F26894E|nr:pseudouridine synthase [Antarcticibacterium sp. 1MA-6-2]UJH91363.1 pseudouridine synthase [Antarcticibacterium sp. 1MA-6-2]